MFSIFETLMYEETRHIVFFVNWMAWQAVRQGQGAAWRRALTSLRFYYRALRRMLATVRRGQQVNDGRDFSATQANLFLEDFTFRRFLGYCYEENNRRMGHFDGNLLEAELHAGPRRCRPLQPSCAEFRPRSLIPRSHRQPNGKG